MLKYLPIVALIVAIPAFVGSCYLWYTGHWVTAIPTTFLAFVSGSLAYTGFLVQRKIEAATNSAMEVAGKHVERVADAVIERVKK